VPVLTREAVAAALALAGIRHGAAVLDLTPAAGLTRAALAMAGPAGSVDHPPVPSEVRSRYAYVLGVWSDRDGVAAIAEARRQLRGAAPGARVVVGSIGALPVLLDGMRAAGWTVLHATAVDEGAITDSGDGQLAFAVARLPAQARSRRGSAA
jgi:hypothetical protein